MDFTDITTEEIEEMHEPAVYLGPITVNKTTN